MSKRFAPPRPLLVLPVWMAAALVACGGGSGASRTSSTIPSVADVPPQTGGSIGLSPPVVAVRCNHGAPLHGPCAQAITLAAAGGFSGSAIIPSGSGTFTMATTISGLSYVPQIEGTPVFEVTLSARTAVLLNGTPGFNLTLPANLSGSLNLAQRFNGSWKKLAGPTPINSRQVAFGPTAPTNRLASGQTLTYGFYRVTPTPVPTKPAPSPKPTPTPTPKPKMADATGTVVDYTTNTPLAGVPIAIAAYTAGAAASPVATTTSTGQFNFTAQPGTYLLVIGSNSAADTKTTLHTKITLVPGANTLTAPTPPAETNVVPTAAQNSGNFRLTTLAGDQLNCFTGTNQGRAQNNLPALIPDEYLTETATAIDQQTNAAASGASVPMFTGGAEWSYETAIGGTGISTLTGDGYNPPCSAWTFNFTYTSGNDGYAAATNAATIWYGANENPSGQTDINNIPLGSATQLWGIDPR